MINKIGKNICLVNDMPGVGKIALSAMIPILSKEGISVASLPTALVSNTLDFGKFDILDTSEYMDKTVDIWNELGFGFEAIAVGFMVNPKQIEIVKKLARNQKTNYIMFVDPIMGDEGKLYNGMGEENVKIMRELSALADVLIPNFTEACFLTNHFYENMDLSTTDAKELIDACRKLQAKSIVITSCKLNGENVVIGYDHYMQEYFSIPFTYIDVRFPGTGDIFSAVLIADTLNGKCLKESVAHAMDVVYSIIKDNKDKKEKYFGVDIEKFIAEGKL